LGLLLLLAFSPATSLANYNLNFADPNSFSITCGKLTSWWSVKNDSCILYTSFLRVETDSSVLTCDFRLNQSGNLDIEDNAYIQYQVNSGEWVTDTSISGYGLDAVWFRTFPLTLHYGEYVQFRVIFETNHQTEFWGLQNGDISISGDFEVYPSEPSPMPVEFIAVECSSNKNTVIIDWITGSETNNDFFTVERSENGVDFYAIGFIDGSGTSNGILQYTYSDFEPITGVSFYRIRQVDFDGQFSFSEIVSANFSDLKEEMIVYSENGIVTVNITSKNETDATLTIIDMTGKSLIREHYIINEGSNSFTSGTGNLYEGIYIVCFAKSDGSSIVKKCLVN
jgi:hypothetical protein